MSTRRVRWMVPVMLAVTPCVADPPVASAPASATSSWVLSDGPALLAEVKDYTFHFDDPAFYWLVRRVRVQGAAPTSAAATGPAPTPWTFMMERPSEFRGKRIVIEGDVKSSQAYSLSPGGDTDWGVVLQTELGNPGSRQICTVVTAEGVEPAPLHSRVRAEGYFLKVRRYRTRSGAVSEAPLLVAARLQTIGMVTGGAPAAASRSVTSPQNMIWFLTGGLAVVWLILRRRVRGQRERVGRLRRPRR